MALITDIEKAEPEKLEPGEIPLDEPTPAPVQTSQPVVTEAAAVARRGVRQLASRGIAIETYDDLWKFSGAVMKSGLAPVNVKTQEAVFVAAQLGMELGLTPMAAVQNITVVHNKPSVYGDLALSLVMRSGLCAEYDEWLEDEKGNRITEIPKNPSDDIKGVSETRRVGMTKSIRRTFSIGQAKQAALWGGGKDNWKLYPDRMLVMRARGRTCHDVYGDVMKGIAIAEEMQDLETTEAKQAAPATPGVGTSRAESLLGRIG